jgi:hypothetical protein
MTWSTRATAPSPDCWLPVRSRANRRRCGKCGAMLSANDMVLLGLSGGDGSVWQRGIACQTVERECSTLMNRPKSEHAMSLKPEKSAAHRAAQEGFFNGPATWRGRSRKVPELLGELERNQSKD